MSEASPKPVVSPEGSQTPDKEKKTLTKAEETAKKVEDAFPTEDANTSESTKSPTNDKGTALWAKESDSKKDEKQTKPPSQTDIMLYQAREMHLLRLEMEAFLNKVFSTLSKSSIQNNTQVSSQPAAAPVESVASQPQTPVTTTVKPEKQKAIEEALKEFIPELLEVLANESNMFYTIRFKKFAGSDNFAKISTICRGLGGSYVSAGKQSHFTIPKQ